MSLTSYGDFSKRLHDKVVGQRIPIVCSIEVTARCNLRCVHCYINLPARIQDAQASRTLGWTTPNPLRRLGRDR